VWAFHIYRGSSLPGRPAMGAMSFRCQAQMVIATTREADAWHSMIICLLRTKFSVATN
jgi:hypothetical protein